MDVALRLPKERVAAVSPESLKAYLNNRGWKRDERASQPAADFYVREAPGQPEAEALVPNQSDIRDYALCVGDALVAIGAAEGRSAFEVLLDIESSPAMQHPAPAGQAMNNTPA